MSIKPFEEDDNNPTNAFFLNETEFQPYQKRMINFGVFVSNVILSVSKKGDLQVLVNAVFMDDYN
jgi:hypothetical protein